MRVIYRSPVIFTVLTCIALSAETQAGFSIKGKVSERSYYQFNPRITTRTFEGIVQTNGWRFSLSRTDISNSHDELVYDSKTYYLERDIPPQKIEQGNEPPARISDTIKLMTEGEIGQLYGYVSEGDLFTFTPPPSVAALWLAYGSFDYFKTHKTVPPFKAQGLPMENIAPGLLQDIPDFKTTELDFFENAEFPFIKAAVVQAPGHIGGLTLAPPWSDGYKYLVYNVDATTNINNVAIPTKMSLVRYSPKLDQNREQRKDIGFYFEIHEVSEVADTLLLPPTIAREMVVEDYRFNDKKLKIPLLRYNIDDEWLAASDPILIKQFEALRNETAKAFGQASTPQKTLFVVLLLSILFLPILLFVRRKGASNHASTT